MCPAFLQHGVLALPFQANTFPCYSSFFLQAVRQHF